MLSSQNTYIDHAMFMQDVFNKSAGMRALRCTEINDHADTCRVNPATGLDECDSDEVSRDTAYPVFHYWMQRSGKHYRCVIDGGQAEDQNRSSGYFQCPLLLDKKKCEGAFKYHNGRSLCQWHEQEKKKESSNMIVSVSSTIANMFSAPKRSRIYEVPESPCRSVCDVDWDKCDNVLCDLTGDYKCRPRRLPDNFRSGRIAGNTASTGIGVVREDGTRSGEDSDFTAGELVYLKDPTAAKLVDTSWWIGRQFRYLRGMKAKTLGMRGRVLASGSKPQEGDSSEKLVTVLFDHEVGGSEPKQLEVKPSALMHGNEAKLVYRGANGTAGSGFVQSSSLFRDPALWSCGYLGNSMPSESAKVAVKNFHPDIVMKNPFTWLHVKIVNVDDPSDVRWNAVFTYKKPTTRVSATAQPNIGATAHWYDSDFYKYPSFGGGNWVLQKMGQMLTAAKSSLVSSVGGKQNLNPATSNKDLRREWSSKVARALSIFTNAGKKKSPAHHLPHYQRVVPFRPLCGPRKAGKRRLFDVSITTDGMALHGMSVPHYDFSLRQLYDYVKKSLWLDMTEESGGIKGQLALSGADEIRRARGTSNSARNGEVLPPDEQDELLKDRKPDKWTKKPVFDMLAGQMIAVPTALRRKLAMAGFVGQMSPQSAFYHVFPRGREVGGVNHPGAFGAGGEPMYYGEHAGIEVVTPL
mmetsp:Transcript_27848/g.70382  ORF Transcript_27848/g.70382 Transcript_27848/m.70382 type:complete len:691 (+) Transcript_27848:355-2427(+)|eukprot:g4825.t1